MKTKMKTFREFINEGIMGGDQRNMRGSVARPKVPDYDGEWNGKSIHVDHPRWETTSSKQSAEKYNVELVPSNMRDKTVEVVGRKRDILEYMVSQGWNKTDVKSSYNL